MSCAWRRTTYHYRSLINGIQGLSILDRTADRPPIPNF
jgi:hypothetical protein